MKWLLALVVVAGGCIEGDSPGYCEISGRCSGGLVCAADYSCQSADVLRDLRVHWLLDGVEPSVSQPGPCPSIDRVGVCLGNDDGGFCEFGACIDGSAVLHNVPPGFGELSGIAYAPDRIIAQSMSQLDDDPPDDVFVMIDLP